MVGYHSNAKIDRSRSFTDMDDDLDFGFFFDSDLDVYLCQL